MSKNFDPKTGSWRPRAWAKGDLSLGGAKTA